VKYFDFDMLNKHFIETVDYISSWVWFIAYLLVIYTCIKLFLKYDK